MSILVISSPPGDKEQRLLSALMPTPVMTTTAGRHYTFYEDDDTPAPFLYTDPIVGDVLMQGWRFPTLDAAKAFVQEHARQQGDPP
jgi:hypothetical protein